LIIDACSFSRIVPFLISVLFCKIFFSDIFIFKMLECCFSDCPYKHRKFLHSNIRFWFLLKYFVDGAFLSRLFEYRNYKKKSPYTKELIPYPVGVLWNYGNFREHKNYVRHLRLCHRSGPFICKYRNLCPQSFRDTGHLLLHIKEAHCGSRGAVMVLSDV
jgi:hypothetical protein